MINRKFAVGLIALGISASASAEYQWEGRVGAGFGEGDFPNGRGFDQYIISLDGTYHFAPVDDTKGARAEAAFLDRASSVSLIDSYSNIEPNRGRDQDTWTYGVSGRYVEQNLGLIGTASWRRSDVDPGSNSDAWSIGGGMYVLETTSVLLTYSEIDPSGRGLDDADFYNLGFEHYQPFGDAGLKVEFGYGFEDWDDFGDFDNYSLRGTYYPDPNFGFGISYEHAESGNDELDSYGPFVEYFVSPGVSVALNYRYAEADNSQAESDLIAGTVRVRF